MKKFTLTLCLWLTFSMFFSQDDQDYSNGNQYVISRYDGGEYIGEIISDDGREILIITQSIGKIYLRKSMISSIKKIENGEITYDEDYKAYPCKCGAKNCCGYIVRSGSRFRINKKFAISKKKTNKSL